MRKIRQAGGILLAAVVAGAAVLSSGIFSDSESVSASTNYVVTDADESREVTLDSSLRYVTDTSFDTINEQMGTGWNLGNQLESSMYGSAGNETAWGNPTVTQELINTIAEAGYDTVRIPVTYLDQIQYDNASGTYYVNDQWLERIEEVVDYVLDAGMYAIINMHGDGYTTVSGSWLLCASSDQNTILKKYSDTWSDIASNFKDYGDHLIFESMNEEFDGTYSTPSTTYYSNINAYNQAFIDSVRQAGGKNTSRWLMICGWNTDINYTANNYGFAMPTDNYCTSSENRIMVTVHYYDPYPYTLGATTSGWGVYAKADGVSIVSYDQEWGQEDYVKERFKLMYDKFVSQGYPVVIGEFGATYQGDTYEKYRQYFTSFTANMAKEYGCIPVVWDNGYYSAGSEALGLFNRSSLQEVFPLVNDAVTNTPIEVSKGNGVLSVYEDSSLYGQTDKVSTTKELKNTYGSITVSMNVLGISDTAVNVSNLKAELVLLDTSGNIIYQKSAGSVTLGGVISATLNSSEISSSATKIGDIGILLSYGNSDYEVYYGGLTVTTTPQNETEAESTTEAATEEVTTEEATTQAQTEAPTKQETVTEETTTQESVTEETTSASTDGTCSVSVAIQSDWGSGATAAITVTNLTGADLNGWRLNIAMDRKITQVWGPVLESSTSNGAVITNPEWSPYLAAGESVTINCMLGSGSSDINVTEAVLSAK